MSSSDHRVIVGQTGQNVLGLAIGAVATFAAQVLITNALGDEAFGVVARIARSASVPVTADVEAGYGPWPEMEAWCLGDRDALAPEAAAA